MDCSYLIVRIEDKKNIELHCFFLNTVRLKYRYPTCMTIHADKLNDGFHLVSLCNRFNILSTSHKLYIGIEIFKACLAIKLDQTYVQE
uniref:Uncharacterized protein n=1 Tax=Laurenciella marilzae TaxID=1413812 RepID=A0A1Z1M1U9_9FLOR|nr:hypothetical protein [Laurenciella marilzae]ARW59754.1 hypothetical protein [Laurenciella marilzae]